MSLFADPDEKPPTIIERLAFWGLAAEVAFGIVWVGLHA